MICPKCNMEQKDGRADCYWCDINFKKHRIEQIIKNRKQARRRGDKKWRGETENSENPLLYIKPNANIVSIYLKCILLVVVILATFNLWQSPIKATSSTSQLLHLVNLPFHEFGHILFRPFGKFITSLGGTLGQLLMPLVCVFAMLVKTRDTFGASISMWWFGENFIDIAPYINDARALSLPLLGGNYGHSSPYGFHDWEYILNESNLLKYDNAIAKLSVAVGSIIMILAIMWAATLLYKYYRANK